MGTEGYAEPYSEEQRATLLGELIEAEIALHDLKAEASRRHAEIDAEIEHAARELTGRIADLRAVIIEPGQKPAFEPEPALNGKPKLQATLQAIREAPSGLSISDVADLAGLAHNVARGSVAGLVRQGFVRRVNGVYIAADVKG